MFTKFTTLARKLPSPLFKIGAQAYIDKEFPRHIFIETTANCNLICSYCPREKRKEEMDFELFKSIIDEASHYGPRSFSLHLFGEPLLYPRILDAISLIKKVHKRNTVLLTTNGTMLNKFARDLEMLKVDRVIWSYRKNNFSEASKRLLKKRGMVRLLKEETDEAGFKEWSVYPRVEIKSLHNYGGNIDVSKWKIKENSLSRYPCYHLWLAPGVRWNGEIVECCNIPQSGTEVLGRYGESTLAEVWSSKAIKELRESHMKGIYPGACNNCTSWQAYPNLFFSSQCKELKNGLE